MECQLKILGRSPAIGVQTRVVAECGCGVIKTYQKGNLQSGSTASCGCKRKAGRPLHGMARTPTYATWMSMRVRCTNPNNKDWDQYGGREITVCERWEKFENFYKDMGNRPEGKQLDRIDNEKGYYLENCRWVTSKQNCNNRRNSIKVEFGYIQLSISELAELGAVSRSTMQYRWNKYKNVWDCLLPPN